MQQLIDGLVQTMESLGYPGIALLMFLEVIFPPIPSELIMPFGGFVAAKGQLNLFLVMLSGSIGSMLGALVFYYLGKILGTERLIKFANKYGRWLTVSGKDIRRADAWFDRYGYFVVFFCRFVPGIRSLVSLPAGVSGMKVLPFLILTLIGNLIWNFALTYAGFLLGDNYELVDRYMGDWGKYVLLTLAAVLGIWYVVRLVKQMREKPEPERGPAPQQPASFQQLQSQQTWMQRQPHWEQHPPSFPAAPPATHQAPPQRPWYPQGYWSLDRADDATIILPSMRTPARPQPMPRPDPPNTHHPDQ